MKLIQFGCSLIGAVVGTVTGFYAGQLIGYYLAVWAMNRMMARSGTDTLPSLF